MESKTPDNNAFFTASDNTLNIFIFIIITTKMETINAEIINTIYQTGEKDDNSPNNY